MWCGWIWMSPILLVQYIFSSSIAYIHNYRDLILVLQTRVTPVSIPNSVHHLLQLWKHILVSMIKVRDLKPVFNRLLSVPTVYIGLSKCWLCRGVSILPGGAQWANPVAQLSVNAEAERASCSCHLLINLNTNRDKTKCLVDAPNILSKQFCILLICGQERMKEWRWWLWIWKGSVAITATECSKLYISLCTGSSFSASQCKAWQCLHTTSILPR